MLKKLFLALLFFGIIFHPLLIIKNEYRDLFGRGYEASYTSLKRLYYNSQYVKKHNPSIIPDEILESFAAGAFLKGLNPILIIHDQPPLGRYIIALSIALFDNPNIATILSLSFSLLGIYLIGKSLLRSSILGLIPVFIFSNEPLFFNKLVYTPLLETIQLPFIVFTLYFFLKANEHKNHFFWYALTSVFFGFVISTRFFVLGAMLCMGLLFYFVWDKKISRIVSFVLTMPISIVILLLSYTKTVLEGSPVLHVFGIQKYMFIYHQEQLSSPFSYWDLLFFNRWHTWWGSRAIIHDSQWVFFWPVATSVIVIYFVLYLMKKVPYNPLEKVLLSWVLFYSLLLSLGDTSTRYFLPLTPFLYILAVSNIKTLYDKVYKSNEK